MMRAFWRTEPLNVIEAALLERVFEAHRLSVFRDNYSSLAMKLAAAGSRNYFSALCAALATFGGSHGPLVETVHFLSAPAPWDLAAAMVLEKKIVPGWGNGFVKGKPDPIWDSVQAFLEENYSAIESKLATVTATLHAQGKNIFPNPSAYTAATAIAIGLPPGLTPWLLVRGRIDGWTELLATPAKG